MNLRAGKLNKRIEIKKSEYVRDQNTGEMVLQDVLLARVWADIVSLTGKELIAANAEHSEVRYNIYIRYRADVTHDCWIERKGLKYDILTILPDNSSGLEYIRFQAAQGVSISGQ